MPMITLYLFAEDFDMLLTPPMPMAFSRCYAFFMIRHARRLMTIALRYAARHDDTRAYVAVCHGAHATALPRAVAHGALPR